MEIREIRRARLLQLIHEQTGHGKQRRLAALIGKAPAQVSQWVNRTRTITEDIARQIELKARKPAGWLDIDPEAPHAATDHYAVVVMPPLAVREPAAPPPPTRDFSDRHLISATDWALLQDVKTAATDDELAAIRERAAVIERKVAERLAAVGAMGDPPPAPPPRRNRR
jgi:hypothetical protein